MKLILSLAAITVVSAVNAQVVVPNAMAGAEGNSIFFLLLDTGGGTRTYQMTIAASQLTGLVNTDINGVQWRLDDSSGAWPSGGTTISNFNVFIGAGVSPTAQSATYADNFIGTPTQVRSGALSFNANDFASGGSPTAWGPTVGFNSSYHYTGGDLTIEYRFTDSSNNVGQPGLDATDADTASGQGTSYIAEWSTSNTDTTASFVNGRALVTRFTTSTVPEPATFAVLGLGAVALIRRRRK